MNNSHPHGPAHPKTEPSQPEPETVFPGAPRIRCPSCGRISDAGPAPGPGGANRPVLCRRCETDLTPLVRLASAGKRLLEQGARLLAAEKWTEATACAELVWQLRHEPGAAELGLIAAVAAGAPPDKIRRWLRRCESVGDG